MPEFLEQLRYWNVSNCEGRRGNDINQSTFYLVTDDLFDKLMNVNVKGVLYCYRAAAAQMIKQGRGGRIIGASSVAGIRGIWQRSLGSLASKFCTPGSANCAAYSISKFGVRAITQTAALEWGQYNITVNAYAPGIIDTEMS